MLSLEPMAARRHALRIITGNPLTPWLLFDPTTIPSPLLPPTIPATTLAETTSICASVGGDLSVGCDAQNPPAAPLLPHLRGSVWGSAAYLPGCPLVLDLDANDVVSTRDLGLMFTGADLASRTYVDPRSRLPTGASFRATAVGVTRGMLMMLCPDQDLTGHNAVTGRCSTSCRDGWGNLPPVMAYRAWWDSDQGAGAGAQLQVRVRVRVRVSCWSHR